MYGPKASDANTSGSVAVLSAPWGKKGLLLYPLRHECALNRHPWIPVHECARRHEYNPDIAAALWGTIRKDGGSGFIHLLLSYINSYMLSFSVTAAYEHATVGDVYNESGSYSNQLLRRGRGFPLGICLQNTGAVVSPSAMSAGSHRTGIFDFFFNIYLPADHAINANDVPEDFSPLKQYAPRDVVHCAPGFRAWKSCIHPIRPEARS
ncbi:hypothetical protein DFH09DRAFT_1098998 [Mycena vulgaris]|nr:hypothetical protein DFH09DRAFT_1098998 [Mycena vulgaris]